MPWPGEPRGDGPWRARCIDRCVAHTQPAGSGSGVVSVYTSMPTAGWEELQRERRRRERYMGDVDAKWEAQSREDDRLNRRWSELQRQGNAAQGALGDLDPAALLNDVAVRVPTDDELALALSWLHTDEPEYSTGAATELIDVHEATLREHTPGTPVAAIAGKGLFVVLAGAERRVLGLLVTRDPTGGVDFIVTATAARGKGVAAAVVTQHIEPALEARGLGQHEVEALPAAVKFWAKLGYGVVKDEATGGGGGGGGRGGAAAKQDDMRIRTPQARERERRRKERQPVKMRLVM
jgi:hypothetical protein